jgi:hypothetical protein
MTGGTTLDGWRRLGRVLTRPVDIMPLVLFRVLFGFLLFLEAAGSIATGWVTEVYVVPEYAFPHVGFGWIRPLPGAGMYVYYALMAVPALLVMIGAHFRPALVVFTAMWALVYLGQTTSYNNHYYLMILLCVLLNATPANADLSLDAERGRVRRSSTCPRWCIGIFVAQVAIVYFYAALAKFDADWLAARPVEIWLRAKQDYPVLGPLYVQPWFKWFVVYGGILFDGLVVPLLLWGRTRWLAVGLSVFFHLFNSYTFRIGIFPYLGIGFCVFFFSGEGMRQWLRTTRLRRFCAAPGTESTAAAVTTSAPTVVLVAYFALQILLPLRHHLYEGNPHWTEQGHRMSWHMMLRTKSGTAVMRVVDRKTGETWTVRPRDMLSPKQSERVATRPDMMWRFSRYVRERYEREGRDVVVYADTRVSLNGRRLQPLFDADIDLSRAPWPWLAPLPWLEPLHEDVGAAVRDVDRGR